MVDESMISAIPTFYNGAQFRSQLEARWAAFFDLAGWRWEYEPPEEDGWIPDFLLIVAKQIVKVEVKPINWTGNDKFRLPPPPGDWRESNAFSAQINKVSELDKVRRYVQQTHSTNNEYYWDYEDVLVLGAYPHCPAESRFYRSDAMLGLFLSDHSIACLAKGYQPRKFDFFSEAECYRYRMGSESDSWHHIRKCTSEEVDQAWREAGNRVQWRAAS
jgi:hypothetical protein